MSTIDEIRARDVADRNGLLTECPPPVADRAYLLELVARLRDCLFEFAACQPVMDDERIRHVEIQVTRQELADAKALCEEAK